MNDDLISRQAAIDAYGDWYVEEGTADGFIGTVKQLLEGFPPAQLSTNLAEVGTDCISRQAAIDEIDEWIKAFRENGHKESAADARLIQDGIIQLPSAQSKPQWISCERELPEDYTDVLAWFEYFRYGDYNCLYQTYGIGSYSMKYDSWTINHETGWHKLRVIAWMPLPEPWRGEEP